MLSFGLKLSHRDVACVTRTAIVCHCDHVTDEFNSKHDNKRQWQLIVSCKYKFDAGNIAKFDFNFIETTKRFPFQNTKGCATFIFNLLVYFRDETNGLGLFFIPMANMAFIVVLFENLSLKKDLEANAVARKSLQKVIRAILSLFSYLCFHLFWFPSQKTLFCKIACIAQMKKNHLWLKCN